MKPHFIDSDQSVMNEHIRTLYQLLLSKMLKLEKEFSLLSHSAVNEKMQNIEKLQEKISQIWLTAGEEFTLLDQQYKDECYSLLKQIQESNTRISNKALAKMASIKDESSQIAVGRRSCSVYHPAEKPSSGRIVSVLS